MQNIRSLQSSHQLMVGAVPGGSILDTSSSPSFALLLLKRRRMRRRKMVCVPPREKGKNGRVKNWIRCNAMGREGRGETKRERETKFPFLRTRLLCSRTHRTAAVAAMCVVVVVVVVKKTRAFHPLEQRRRQRQSRWKGGRERNRTDLRQSECVQR